MMFRNKKMKTLINRHLEASIMMDILLKNWNNSMIE